MAVKVEMHNGESFEYESAVRVAESDHAYTLYDEAGNVLARLHKFDVKNLHTKDVSEKW